MTWKTSALLSWRMGQRGGKKITWIRNKVSSPWLFSRLDNWSWCEQMLDWIIFLFIALTHVHTHTCSKWCTFTYHAGSQGPTDSKRRLYAISPTLDLSRVYPLPFALWAGDGHQCVYEAGINMNEWSATLVLQYMQCFNCFWHRPRTLPTPPYALSNTHIHTYIGQSAPGALWVTVGWRLTFSCDCEEKMKEWPFWSGSAWLVEVLSVGGVRGVRGGDCCWLGLLSVLEFLIKAVSFLNTEFTWGHHVLQHRHASKIQLSSSTRVINFPNNSMPTKQLASPLRIRAVWYFLSNAPFGTWYSVICHKAHFQMLFTSYHAWESLVDKLGLKLES